MVIGTIRSPGGPYLYDRYGRVVFFHGVNAVYKRFPYELTVSPGKPFSLTRNDAAEMARMGFNVVRLGMIWEGLEPGHSPANDPAICTPGRGRDPHEYDQRVVDAYLARIAQTVAMLGHFGIYTLLDMHQDVYNEMFDGEGAPNWAVCTDGHVPTDVPGRWSYNYGTKTAGVAYDHFWNNDVVGNLQGEYDRVWAAVARAFRKNSWILGYDPFNEPFSTSLLRHEDEQFDATIECFYTGTAHIGSGIGKALAIACPKDDPREGVIPRILAADPSHLVFYETDIFSARSFTNFVGPMNFRNLVFNVHVYCTRRQPLTGQPLDVGRCIAQDQQLLAVRAANRLELGSPAQPGGPAWFVSEFGASPSAPQLRRFADRADESLVGWAYWSWKFYDDPTGSTGEALVGANGKIGATAKALIRPYARAVAGVPTSLSFDSSAATFVLTYQPKAAITAPTVVFVPTSFGFARGYCAQASGGTVTSAPGRSLLTIVNDPTSRVVTVIVRAGPCGAG